MIQSDCNQQVERKLSDETITYHNLKKTFVEKFDLHCNGTVLSSLVEKMKDSINSERACSKVLTISDLLTILEYRDELSSSNVGKLSVILTFVGLDRGVNWMFMLRKLINGYPREEVKSNPCSCNNPQCGSARPNRHLQYAETFRPPSPPPAKYELDSIKIKKSIQDDLQVIFKNMGTDWKKFLRNLPGFSERNMNEVRDKYRDDVTCFWQCLELWKKTAEDNVVTRKSLLEALKKINREDVVFPRLSEA